MPANIVQSPSTELNASANEWNGSVGIDAGSSKMNTKQQQKQETSPRSIVVPNPDPNDPNKTVLAYWDGHGYVVSLDNNKGVQNHDDEEVPDFVPSDTSSDEEGLFSDDAESFDEDEDDSVDKYGYGDDARPSINSSAEKYGYGYGDDVRPSLSSQQHFRRTSLSRRHHLNRRASTSNIIRDNDNNNNAGNKNVSNQFHHNHHRSQRIPRRRRSYLQEKSTSVSSIRPPPGFAAAAPSSMQQQQRRASIGTCAAFNNDPMMDGRNGSFHGDNNHYHHRHFQRQQQQQHRLAAAPPPPTRRSSLTSSFSNHIRPEAVAQQQQQQRRASIATCAAAPTFPVAFPDDDASLSSPYECLDIHILKEIDPDSVVEVQLPGRRGSITRRRSITFHEDITAVGNNNENDDDENQRKKYDDCFLNNSSLRGLEWDMEPSYLHDVTKTSKIDSTLLEQKMKDFLLGTTTTTTTSSSTTTQTSTSRVVGRRASIS